jgi:hypothetical protein
MIKYLEDEVTRCYNLINGKGIENAVKETANA